MSIPQHYLIPFSITINDKIKSIFFTQLVEMLSIDCTTFVNKFPTLPKHHGRLLSRVK